MECLLNNLYSVCKFGKSHGQNTSHLLLNTGFAGKLLETEHRMEGCGPRTEGPGQRSQELG